ncbi:MAG: outer membrane protein assembly factor BamA, partial [Bacteroidales bacterium]|nr:outer membrane protein assembly factor BamA [Bacteroidales bacterium]
MYSSEQLSHVLGIKKGDVYNSKVLDEKLLYDPVGVMALYQDNGYLFSNVQPIEVLVENDSIDLEMRIYEGKQATINRVTLVGNTRTNDHVIMREVRTRPGSLYNRSEVQRTIRELAQLGYFDPEKLNVDFNPDPVSGTVDLEYTVEEKPSDQIQVSGGYGSGMFVGTLGVTFNNFSLRNIFNFKSYRPLPTGDGQRLSIQASASGLWYQNYSFSFVDPWFGGKKP